MYLGAEGLQTREKQKRLPKCSFRGHDTSQQHPLVRAPKSLIAVLCCELLLYRRIDEAVNDVLEGPPPLLKNDTAALGPMSLSR
jgi:hypothetical protein